MANDHRPPATSSLAHWLTGHPNGPLTAPSPPTTHHRLTGTRLTGSPTYTALPANRLTGSPTHWLTGSLATTGHLLTCSGSPATCSPAHRPPAHLTGSPATCSPTHRLTGHLLTGSPATGSPATGRPPASKIKRLFPPARWFPPPPLWPGGVPNNNNPTCPTWVVFVHL